MHKDFKKQTCCQQSDDFIYSTPALSVIFLNNCMQCVDGFSILLQRYVTKDEDGKNPAIFSFCLLPFVNVRHAEVLEVLEVLVLT